MLDDHILKAQTMHSSAYIKPFEEEMKEWEDKLISMQDILDAWLRCQESWLYLEPIFNSEDIMKQMPVEGRKFNKVLETKILSIAILEERGKSELEGSKGPKVTYHVMRL